MTVRRVGWLVLGLGLCAAGFSGLVSRGASSEARATTTHGRTVVVYGYPYAQNCPEAGFVDSIDRWDMYQCNCTSYVAWALTANRQRIDWFVRGAMDAWNWPNVARRSGLQVRAIPRVGAVAVWGKLTSLGHIAYVTGIERDGRIDVAEYNFPGQSWFSPLAFDTREDVRVRRAVFIYVPDLDGFGFDSAGRQGG